MITCALRRGVLIASLLVGCTEPEEFPCVRTAGTSTCTGCDAGFHLEGATCVPSPTLTIAPLPAEVQADGVTTVPIQITGTHVDGTPVTEPVTVALSRLGAGTLSDDMITLAAGGSTVTYAACDSDVASCLGTLRVTVSLARARQVSASASFALVVPPLIARCAGPGNALYFRGTEGAYIFSSTRTWRAATWNTTSANANGGGLTIEEGSDRWHVDLSAPTGSPLIPGTYNDARRFEDATHPGLDIGGNGRGCNQVFGEFEVIDYAFDVDGVTRMVATFEHHCEQLTAPELRGCLRYQR